MLPLRILNLAGTSDGEAAGGSDRVRQSPFLLHCPASEALFRTGAQPCAEAFSARETTWARPKTMRAGANPRSFSHSVRYATGSSLGPHSGAARSLLHRWRLRSPHHELQKVVFSDPPTSLV